MFTFTKKDNSHELDESITSLISDLAGLDSDSDAYIAAITALKALMEARNADKAEARANSLSAESVAKIAANLLGIGLILGFEKANVLTTKSLSFVPKVPV